MVDTVMVKDFRFYKLLYNVKAMHSVCFVMLYKHKTAFILNVKINIVIQYMYVQ